MSDDPTPRFALPVLQPGQAQKELYHNEALALIDLGLHPCVIAMGVDTPPSAPILGACWIIGTAPTGVWAAAANYLAGWTAGGWRFVAPQDGMTVWSLQDGVYARFAAGNWTIGEAHYARLLIDSVQVIGPQQPSIANPVGGSVIDGEARASIATIIDALATHGLIAR